MALSEERRLEARHAILAFAAEQDTRSFDWAELELPAIEGLADSTVAAVLDELVQDGDLTELDTNTWKLPGAAEENDEPPPPADESGDDVFAGATNDGEFDDDGSRLTEEERAAMMLGDDWIRLPAVADGKAIAMIELDAALVAALARIHPAERATIVTQIEAGVRNVLRETRRLMPSRDSAGEFELVDYAELIVGEAGEPA